MALQSACCTNVIIMVIACSDVVVMKPIDGLQLEWFLAWCIVAG